MRPTLSWAASLGRSGGYIVGPAVAGWLLGTLQPVEVYTIIGVVSCLAFLPLALLGPLRRSATPASSLREQLRCSLGAGARTGAVWLAGGLDSVAFIALYALATLSLGYYYSRKQRSTQEYFTGSGHMNSTLIGSLPASVSSPARQ